MEVSLSLSLSCSSFFLLRITFIYCCSFTLAFSVERRPLISLSLFHSFFLSFFSSSPSFFNFKIRIDACWRLGFFFVVSSFIVFLLFLFWFWFLWLFLFERGGPRSERKMQHWNLFFFRFLFFPLIWFDLIWFWFDFDLILIWFCLADAVIRRIGSRILTRRVCLLFLLGFTGFYLVLLVFTKFFWLLTGGTCFLPSFSGFYRVFFRFYLVSPSFNGFYWTLPGFTGFYRVLLGFTGFYWVLLGFTLFYWC